MGLPNSIIPDAPLLHGVVINIARQACGATHRFATHTRQLHGFCYMKVLIGHHLSGGLTVWQLDP